MYMQAYAIVVYDYICGVYAYHELMRTYARVCIGMIYACLCKFLCMYMQKSYASLCSVHICAYMPEKNRERSGAI